MFKLTITNPEGRKLELELVISSVRRLPNGGAALDCWPSPTMKNGDELGTVTIELPQHDVDMISGDTSRMTPVAVAVVKDNAVGLVIDREALAAASKACPRDQHPRGKCTCAPLQPSPVVVAGGRR